MPPRPGSTVGCGLFFIFLFEGVLVSAGSLRLGVWILGFKALGGVVIRVLGLLG